MPTNAPKPVPVREGTRGAKPPNSTTNKPIPPPPPPPKKKS